MSVEIEYKSNVMTAESSDPWKPHYVAVLGFRKRGEQESLPVWLNARQCRRLIDFLSRLLPRTEPPSPTDRPPLPDYIDGKNAPAVWPWVALVAMIFGAGWVFGWCMAKAIQ